MAIKEEDEILNNPSFDYKRLFVYIAVILIGIVLVQLILIAEVKLNFAEPEDMYPPYFYRSLLGILLGILVKWRGLINMLKKNVEPNIKLPFGIVLGVISIIPPYIFTYFGIGSVVTLDILTSGNISAILRSLFLGPFMTGYSVPLVLSVIAGVLIIEGVHNSKNIGQHN